MRRIQRGAIQRSGTGTHRSLRARSAGPSPGSRREQVPTGRGKLIFGGQRVARRGRPTPDRCGFSRTRYSGRRQHHRGLRRTSEIHLIFALKLSKRVGPPQLPETLEFGRIDSRQRKGIRVIHQ